METKNCIIIKIKTAKLYPSGIAYFSEAKGALINIILNFNIIYLAVEWLNYDILYITYVFGYHIV